MHTKLIMVLFVVAVVALSQTTVAAQNIIYVNQTAPFSDPLTVAKAVVDSCDLPARQMVYIEEAAKGESSFTLVRDEDAVKAMKGRVLLVEIANAISGGNAFAGHQKEVSVRGRLLQDGVEIGNFGGVRRSSGGFGAGFKSSCAVLERCVRELGEDIVKWLKNPQKNSRIGD